MQRKLYKALASAIATRTNYLKFASISEWQEIYEDNANELIQKYLPSGSGFDSGTTIDWDKSTRDRLVFQTSFHHMNDGGYYDGWTKHTISVRPSLIHGFTITVSGPNRNDIKDFIIHTFDSALSTAIEENPKSGDL